MLRSSRLLQAAILIVLLMMAFAPFAASAAIPTIVPCDGVDCNICDIAKLAQNLINAGIYIAIFLSAILFAYAGWQYMTAGGEPGKASEGKRIFWNVGVGLALILAAWLIIDLIMKVLVDQGATFGPWNEVCYAGQQVDAAGGFYWQ
jgi:hypothetical protein